MSVAPGLDLPLVARGKVREVYDASTPAAPDRLLLVASDRISAYDHVLPTPIPDKGRVLTQLSVWWFDQLAPVLSSFGATHHLLSASDVPAEVAGRAMLVRRLEMLPVECVARGYLSGSGTVEYQHSGAIVDVPLPAGLVENLVVDADRMRANLESTGGLIYTSAVLLELVESGMGREQSYALVQSAAMQTWQTGTPFRGTLRKRAADSGVALDEVRLDEICRPERYVANLGPLFDRLAALS